MECFTVYADEVEGRIDPHFYRPEFRELESNLHNNSHKLLGEVIEFSSETWNQKNIFDSEFPYIEISEIDITSGEIQNITYYKKSEAPSRAKMMVRENDIIVSTTRPNRGAIALIDKEKTGFIASTGFAILRNLKIDIEKKYLLFFLRTNLSLTQLLQRSSGGNYPAITTEEMKKIIIPTPSKQKQANIVQLVEKAYSLKKSHEAEAQQLLDSLNDYVLDELGIKLPELKDKMVYVVNSEEVQNKRADAYYYQPKFEEVEKTIKKGKFEVKTIGEITEKVTSGATPLSKGDAYTSKEEGIPFIRSGDINEDKNINFDDVLYIKQEIHNKVLSGSKLKRGDVLIAIVGATIGQVSLYDYDKEANINQAIALVRLKKEVNPEFVKAFMLSTLGQKQLDRIKRPVARANINLDETRSIKIILPSLAIQNRIAEEVKNRMQKAKQLQKEAKEELGKAKREVETIILGTG